AMEAHRIYSREVAHPVEVWAGEKDHLKTWLSKRLDRSLPVPDLEAAGLALVGGRLLPSANGPAAQLMYEDDAGHRVTLYIIPADEGQESSFQFVRRDRLEAFFWTAEALSCALVGELPRERLHEIATLAYKQSDQAAKATKPRGANCSGLAEAAAHGMLSASRASDHLKSHGFILGMSMWTDGRNVFR